MRRVILSCSLLALLSLPSLAQEVDSTPAPAAKAQAATTKASADAPAKTVEKTKATEKVPDAKVQQATLNNLQMTVTGNQEQPRVLYILPWQSPATTDVDFEPLDNQQRSVFGHIEREELRRELESVGE